MIKNLPKEARNYRFIIYREIGGTKYFYKACNNEKLARLIVALTGYKIC